MTPSPIRHYKANSQTVNKYVVFYDTQKFINVLTSDRHHTVSCATWPSPHLATVSLRTKAKEKYIAKRKDVSSLAVLITPDSSVHNDTYEQPNRKEEDEIWC